ncbi:unnamed protein product [Symbiodinium sp. KB8]|nr:unnamed protein product [Symbiodinium sp. KB8]
MPTAALVQSVPTLQKAERLLRQVVESGGDEALRLDHELTDAATAASCLRLSVSLATARAGGGCHELAGTFRPLESLQSAVRFKVLQAHAASLFGEWALHKDCAEICQGTEPATDLLTSRVRGGAPQGESRAPLRPLCVLEADDGDELEGVEGGVTAHDVRGWRHALAPTPALVQRAQEHGAADAAALTAAEAILLHSEAGGWHSLATALLESAAPSRASAGEFLRAYKAVQQCQPVWSPGSHGLVHSAAGEKEVELQLACEVFVQSELQGVCEARLEELEHENSRIPC